MAEEERQQRRKISVNGDFVDTSKPTAFFQPTGGRDWTVSIAIPGSIISHCRRDDQRTNIVSHLARALAIFCVDEVVVFDDSPLESRPQKVDENGYTGDTDPCGYLEQLLSYLEVPPFMRKILMPIHPNLRSAGLLGSLHIPPHPHADEWIPYREGVTTSESPPSGEGTLVDVGSKTLVQVDDEIPPKTRITLKMSADSTQGELTHPQTPRVEDGYYWGFSVRRCTSLSAVFEECAFQGGYDMSIGTSERGRPISDAFPEPKKKKDVEKLKFNHLIIAFGGPRGLEHAAENDPSLLDMGIIRGKTKDLFDAWVNFKPKQGSRTIRTDEAVYIGLTALSRLWEANC